jgi:hypothetical protein
MISNEKKIELLFLYKFHLHLSLYKKVMIFEDSPASTAV